MGSSVSSTYGSIDAARDGRDERDLVAVGQRGRAVGVGTVDRDAEGRRLRADTEARPDVARGGAVGQLDLDGRRAGALAQHREEADADADHAQGRTLRGRRAAVVNTGGTGRFIDRQSSREPLVCLRVPATVAPTPESRCPLSRRTPGRTSSASRARSRSRAARAPTATGRAPGRCASTPASRRPRRRTAGSGCCSSAARPGCRWRSTCRRSSGLDSDDPRAAGEVGRTGVGDRLGRGHGAAVRRHPARRGRLDVDDHQRAGVAAAAAVRTGRHGAGRRSRRISAARSRTTSSRSTARAGTTSSRRGPRCG